MTVVAESYTLTEFRHGLSLRNEAWKIPPNALLVAENAVVTEDGIRPLKDLGSAISHGLGAGTWKSIFKLNGNWMASTNRRWINRWQNSYAAFVEDGVAPPKWTNASSTSSLGLTAPTAALTATDAAAGVITNTDAKWAYTWTDALTQESGASPPSNSLNLAERQASFSALGTPPGSATGWNLYRILNGTWLLQQQGTVSSLTPSNDNTANLSLGPSALLTFNGGAAPNLQGMAIGSYDSRLGGWIGNNFYQTEAGAPYAWLPGGIPPRENVVAAAGTALGWLILTEAKPYLLRGEGINTKLDPKENNFGCVAGAGFSLAETDFGWIWWSPKGLVLYTPGGEFVELMKDDYDAEDIAGFTGSGMEGVWDTAAGEYLLGHTGGTLRCCLAYGKPIFTTSDQTIGATFRDNDGKVYVAVGNDIKRWADPAAANRTMTIRTREFAAPNTQDRLPIFCARIRCDAQVTVQWYQEGVAHGSSETLTPENGEVLAWADRGLQNRGALEIVTAGAIHDITINPPGV